MNNNCPTRVEHIIQKGDNLYHLANRYNTTVPAIWSRNPGIDPYNLKPGSMLVICPGSNTIIRPGMSNGEEEMNLSNSMRKTWQQHVYWVRMLLISIAERLRDQNDVSARLLQNPKDIANIFGDFYNPAAAKTIENLLTEHLQIGAGLITALRDGQTAEANRLDRQWYINADKMADALSSLNPYYSRDDLRNMLYSHLDLTKQEVAMRLAGRYAADIDAFNKVEQEAMNMADTFTDGIISQFPQKF